MSTPDTLSSPATTTTPDDVFYILKVVIGRLLSTGAPQVVERTAAQLRDAVERDYAGVLKRKMDEVYRNAGAGRERETSVTFIVSREPAHLLTGSNRFLDVTERPGCLSFTYGETDKRYVGCPDDDPRVPCGRASIAVRQYFVLHYACTQIPFYPPGTPHFVRPKYKC